MKKKMLLLIAVSALIACNNSKKTNDNSLEQNTIQQKTSNNSKSENINKGDEPSNVLLGTWTGEMSEKNLTIVIEKINGTELDGYNTLGSNRRNFNGTFTDGDWDQPCTKAYLATLNESDDEQGGGVFTIKFVGYEDEEETEMGPECRGNLKGEEAHGEWKPNNSKTKTEIHLVKQN